MFLQIPLLASRPSLVPGPSLEKGALDHQMSGSPVRFTPKTRVPSLRVTREVAPSVPETMGTSD